MLHDGIVGWNAFLMKGEVREFLCCVVSWVCGVEA